jgi:zinc protease
LSGPDILATRPGPAQPRAYHFPAFERARLANGLTVITAHLPGRPLLAAHLLLEGGAGEEPPEMAGVSALLARALPEGTAQRDAVELVEAGERLGAELHAQVGWETIAASLDVPRRHFGEALALLAEMVLQPSFPAHEVDRLRDERMNDLLQAAAEPRRRVERAFTETLYAPGVPYARLLAGDEQTVPRLTRDALVARHAGLLDSSAATLIVAGDLTGLPVVELAAAHLGDWPGTAGAGAAAARQRLPDGAGRPRTLVVDRRGAPQSELRIGHVGLARKIPDFYAVVVMSAILGGLFNSRLQRLLREERGYTYGIQAGFDFRRSAGPFAVRSAVQTEVCAAAVLDILGELRRIREAPITADELHAAQDFLIGVFPLRFETAAQVVGAITGLVVHGLPDDELDRYRPAVAALDADEVLAAALEHVHPEALSIVMVGDAERVVPDLEAAGLDAIEVVRDVARESPAGEG